MNDSIQYSDRDLLIKLATDVEYIKASIDELKKEREECEDKCNRRIGKLERWQAYVMGIAAGISFIVAVAVSLWRG